MVADVLQSDGDVFEAGAPRPLIETGVAALPPGALPDFLYDAAPDGQRFLINEPISAPSPAEITTERTVALKVVLNWSMGLDAR